MKGLFCILVLVALLNTDTVYGSENKDIKHTCRAYERIYNKYCYHSTNYDCNKIKSVYWSMMKANQYEMIPREYMYPGIFGKKITKWCNYKNRKKGKKN